MALLKNIGSKASTSWWKWNCRRGDQRSMVVMMTVLSQCHDRPGLRRTAFSRRLSRPDMESRRDMGYWGSRGSAPSSVHPGRAGSARHRCNQRADCRARAGFAPDCPGPLLRSSGRDWRSFQYAGRVSWFGLAPLAAPPDQRSGRVIDAPSIWMKIVASGAAGSVTQIAEATDPVRGLRPCQTPPADWLSRRLVLTARLHSSNPSAARPSQILSGTPVHPCLRSLHDIPPWARRALRLVITTFILERPPSCLRREQVEYRTIYLVVVIYHNYYFAPISDSHRWDGFLGPF